MASEPKVTVAAASDESENDDEGFEDADDKRAMSDEEAIKEVIQAMDLVLRNKFTDATELLKSCMQDSMYHALGYGTILWIQAMMTFEQADIQRASEGLKHAADVSNKRRKKVGLMKSMVVGSQLGSMGEDELQAEICHAESLLLRALCTFVEDESMVAFIKGGLKVRQSYLSYKDCNQFVTKVANAKAKVKDSKTDGKDEKKRKIPRMPSWQKLSHASKDSLSKDNETGGEDVDVELNGDFVSGVYLGYGAFNLLLSLLPPRALKLLEFIGFSGNREAGLEQLTQAGASNTLRSPVCNLTLLAYNFFIVYVMCLSEKPDMALSNAILDEALKRYPQGAIYAFYAGRRHLIQGQMDKAIAEYQRSVSAQSDWVQLHHICYWELMHAHSAQRNWRDAAKFAKRLVTDSKWSKATYQYLEATYTYMAIHHDSDHPPTDQELKDLASLFAAVAPFKQRIAGKSIPMEKFAIRKSRKFEMQSQYLMLPALEMMYAWSVFQYMATDHLQTMLLLVLDAIADIQREFEEASARQEAESSSSSKKKKGKEGKASGMRHEHITDDLCLGYLLKGHIELLLTKADAAEKSLQEVLSNEAGISLDHWLAPFARVELALLYRKTNRSKEAKEQLQTAMNSYKGYSMENRLHFRIHSGLMELGGYKD